LELDEIAPGEKSRSRAVVRTTSESVSSAPITPPFGKLEEPELPLDPEFDEELDPFALPDPLELAPDAPAPDVPEPPDAPLDLELPVPDFDDPLPLPPDPDAPVPAPEPLEPLPDPLLVTGALTGCQVVNVACTSARIFWTSARSNCESSAMSRPVSNCR
jgi:hypothetical protein